MPGRQTSQRAAYPVCTPRGTFLPTLPLWLDENLVFPLELETCFEEACEVLRAEVTTDY